MKILTPAKVTLALRILTRRADGFHEVRLLLVPVSLCDTLIFRFGGPENLGMETTGEEVPGPPEANLALRAAQAFRQASGLRLSLSITLHKTIPVGAGLGGGSGNAAGTLALLNSVHGRPLSDAGVEALALTLGSDVPFFLRPRPSLARGRGERLRPVSDFPELALLIVKPPFPIATTDAYRLARPEPAPPPFPDWDSPKAVVRGLCNDFEAVLFPRYPALAEIKGRLLALGAAGAVLSGTGSAVVGVFADAGARDEAARVLNQEAAWRVIPCHVLHEHRYEPLPESG